ncbi:MAG: hypothetical protein P0Y53_00260 [Candidatus Pseudobacter hemicellulosilyticus]|uniref:Uncharacterized protein n=1 Tax=Candidatus Pseudobacter hemicellulosilyticus TaxID=3121375 RepID=A0AAJ6BI56_9BACT|nr:MAG: hypothetical protein P0Y53_00260 [Pseudobacter sp.]
MKQFLVAILLLLYAGASTGATVHMHYCMGRLVKTALSDGKQEACSKCGSASDKDLCKKKCCKDEYKLVKMDKDQKTTTTIAFHFLQAMSLAMPVQYAVAPATTVLSATEEFPVTHAPPRSSKVQPYIFLCTFRI